MKPKQPLLWQTRPLLKLTLIIGILPALYGSVNFLVWGFNIFTILLGSKQPIVFDATLAFWLWFLLSGLLAIITYVCFWFVRTSDQYITVVYRSMQITLVSMILLSVIAWSLVPLVSGIANFIFGLWWKSKWIPIILQRF